MREKLICTNKKAYFFYNIEETYEVGIQLLGCEVKSLRQGKANLNDSFAKIINGEIFLYNFHISPYPHSREAKNLDPTRTRKLLLKKSEIKKLLGKVQQKGYTLIPLKAYFNERGLAKIELALAKGKKIIDRREEIKRKDLEREMKRKFKIK